MLVYVFIKFVFAAVEAMAQNILSYKILSSVGHNNLKSNYFGDKLLLNLFFNYNE